MAPQPMLLQVLIFILLSIATTVHSKRYDLSPGWRLINNGSLMESSDPGQTTTPSYRILTAENGQPMVSDNGTFSLSFYDPNGTGNYFLSVLLHVGKNKSATPPSLVVPVWIANYNSSVSDGATLMLTKTHQKLLLLDGGTEGALRWNSGATNISGVELNKFGNLILYGDNGANVWQSFDQPTEVLVPGQQLKTGASMISLNRTSPGSMKPGKFSGTMEPSGFVLNVLPESEVTMANILRTPQPYRVWSIYGTPGNSLELAKTGCSSPAVMTLTANSIEISYGSSHSCGAGMKVFQQSGDAGDAGDAPRYVRLEDNGDLVLYEFDGGKWTGVFHFSDKAVDTCRLPTACGSYGLCTGHGKCRCIGDSDVDDKNHSSESESSCSPPPGVSASCLANEAENHHFVKVDGATYFSNLYVRADLERSSEEDCRGLCISNCSCAAAFYRKRSGSCFLVDEVMGSFTMDPMQSDSTAFVKIQNSRLVVESRAREVTSKSARTAIVFLSVLCVGLIVTLAAVFWFVRSRYPQAYNKLMRRTT